MDLELALQNRFANAAATRYTVELVNDRGRVIMTPIRSDFVLLASRASSGPIPISLPSGLANGFYTVRLTAAAISGSEEAAELVRLFFKVEAGEITQLTNEEFHRQSNVNLGVAR